jgi:hypothetical protein
MLHRTQISEATQYVYKMQSIKLQYLTAIQTWGLGEGFCKKFSMRL